MFYTTSNTGKAYFVDLSSSYKKNKYELKEGGGQLFQNDIFIWR